MTHGKNLVSNENKDFGDFLQFCHEIYRTAQLTGDIVSWEDISQAQSSDHSNSWPIVTERTHNHSNRTRGL